MKNQDLLTKFAINSIVSGKVAGQFVILGFRLIANEWFAQVKRYDAKTGQVANGEFALPLDAIQ